VRAVVIADGTVSVQEVPDPAPGPGELLVRVEGAGLNAADLLQRAGLYPAPIGSPQDIPGMELAGRVERLGPGATGWTPGDRVMAVVGGGAQAELAVVLGQHALRVPVDVPLAAAGGFPEAFSTAHDALVTQGRLAAGERVLVTGAAGGVGTAAVQLAHALGAVVVACTREGRHEAAMRDLGADEVVAPEGVADAGPYDVVMELVGAASLSEVQHHLARFARVVVIGVGGGVRVEVDLLGVMSRRWSLTGSTLRARSVEGKALVAEGVRKDVLGLLEHGELTVPVFATFALDDVDAAYDAFAQPGKLGKLVLTLVPTSN